MNLLSAIELTVQDVRQSYPHLSRPLAIAHVINTVSVAELDWENGITAPAYKGVLEASTAQLVLGIARLSNIALERGDVVEIDGQATIDSMDPYEWLDALLHNTI
jgi:hypothetical protein